jgi:hypothetical protein
LVERTILGGRNVTPKLQRLVELWCEWHYFND